MNKEKYLPIGTVCLLKNAKKKIMIVGYMVESNGKKYDYVGCFFPEGMIFFDKQMMFNHDQIKTIYYLGYTDAEQKNFFEQLKKLAK